MSVKTNDRNFTDTMPKVVSSLKRIAEFRGYESNLESVVLNCELRQLEISHRVDYRTDLCGRLSFASTRNWPLQLVTSRIFNSTQSENHLSRHYIHSSLCLQ